jgi:pimeloyl-ACP methyl ester carboxylesterase
VADPDRADERAAFLKRMTARRDVWRAVAGVIDRASITGELPRIAAPTTVVVGEEDVATVPAKAERLHAAIAGSTLVRIPRAGHSSSVEEPAAVTAAIEAHLARLEP